MDQRPGGEHGGPVEAGGKVSASAKSPAVRAVCAVTAVLLVASFAGALGCDRKKASPSAQSKPAAPIDWSKVAAPDELTSMAAFTHLARYADVWHGGKKETVRLKFVAPSSVTDEAEHSASMTPEGWKGTLTLIRRSGSGSAIRALPASAETYGDGLGKAQRFAYTVTIEGEWIVLKKAKALEGESDG